MHTRYLLSIHFDINNAWRFTKLDMQKSDKNNLRITYAFSNHMYIKTLIKFQKNRHKTVGGSRVAHTRYPLSTHFDIIKQKRLRNE